MLHQEISIPPVDLDKFIMVALMTKQQRPQEHKLEAIVRTI